MSPLGPTTEAEAAAFISEARRAGKPLVFQGGGTRAGLGRPINAAQVMTSRGLTGITLHEPAELVISARAGTPLVEVEAKLAAAGQVLPFEPVDLRPLYGTTGEPTVGGIVAGNWSGPRRVAVGAARDHLIGVRFVNGRGEAVKSGGRVMKNVTGLDLVKLQCGAHGTLGFLTEVTFKVLPKPESTATLVYGGLDDRRGVALLTDALTSPFEVSGAAHLPPGTGGAGARTLVRLEGFSPSVDYRCNALQSLLAEFGMPVRLTGPDALELWTEVRDARFLAEPREHAVWRLSTPPTSGPGLVDRLRNELDFVHFYDWGGGLIWLSTAATGDAGAAAIRQALGPDGGHATLLRAPDGLRAATPVFQPLAPALLALTRRIKASFDPDAILNPGRMYAEA
ncbi:glycolate oxidase subunit GlcE [Lichenifustis flavocetrariae]|uniref:Glycolate oxidase subunit GlcE n=1 Tax=Lichenifustis flavocetrariae TaxID=2949735 RepID=A0AA41YX44_9HYPH|nr:glycolate oxidase subunit GlcE [Lichenifustis flavocetrariae]MCW6506548.1 glycolate oxidase subunit GlcE [Lichenifustis flavocetrariae]